MSFDLTTITSEAVTRPPRMILLGVEKIGKSSFASKSYKPMFIPVKGEEGIDDIQCAKLPAPVQSFDEAMGWIMSLHSGEHDHGTVVIDSTSTLEPLVWARTCAGSEKSCGGDIEKFNGGYGKGYGAALNHWRAMTDWLDALRRDRGMSSILIGHVTVKRIDDPMVGSYDSFVWDIHHKAASLLYRWADLIMFCNSKVTVKSEDAGFGKEIKRGADVMGGRYLYTQKRPSHPGGGRGVFGRIPYELPLDWDRFMQEVKIARNAC